MAVFNDTNNNPRSNTPLLSGLGKLGSFGTSSRQQRRYYDRVNIQREFIHRFAGRGRGGNLQWSEELCPRSRRRSIIRDAVRNRRKGAEC